MVRAEPWQTPRQSRPQLRSPSTRGVEGSAPRCCGAIVPQHIFFADEQQRRRPVSSAIFGLCSATRRSCRGPALRGGRATSGRRKGLVEQPHRGSVSAPSRPARCPASPGALGPSCVAAWSSRCANARRCEAGFPRCRISVRPYAWATKEEVSRPQGVKIAVKRTGDRKPTRPARGIYLRCSTGGVPISGTARRYAMGPTPRARASSRWPSDAARLPYAQDRWRRVSQLSAGRTRPPRTCTGGGRSRWAPRDGGTDVTLEDLHPWVARTP